MKYIIIAALEAEAKGLEKFAPVVFTGVGKVNAVLHSMAAIQRYQPELIINFGTAGSLLGLTGLQRVDTIIQHDMDVRPLGFNRGVTPFTTDHDLPSAHGVVLATGDVFITNPKEQLEGIDIAIDLVDMEAFAIQQAALLHSIKFECFKFVSDDGNDDSVDDWQTNVSKGAALFAEVLTEYYGVSSLI